MATEAAASKNTKFNEKGDWPGVGEILSGTFEAMKNNKEFLYVFVGVMTAIGLLSYVVDGNSGGAYSLRDASGLAFLELAAAIILTPASIFYALYTSKGAKADWQEFINKGFTKLLPLIGLGILAGLAIMLGFLLLIIPGIYLVLKLCLSSYALVDQDLGPVEAMKKSFAITKGNVGKVAVYIGMTLILAFGVSVFTSWIPVVGNAANALLTLFLAVFGAFVYRWVNAHPENTTN